MAKDPATSERPRPRRAKLRSKGSGAGCRAVDARRGRPLVKAGRKVHVCQEAGPRGFGLHQPLQQVGAESLVVVAKALADARQQKTDGLDASALTDELDRYLRANTKAFSVISVPTPEQEQDAPAAGCASSSSAVATNGRGAGAACSSPRATTSGVRGGVRPPGKSCARNFRSGC